MAQINVNDLTFCYEGSFDNIFEKVSFSIDTNWKLGFIGRNGKGKSTFLNLLLGKYEYEGVISTNTVFDYFPYEVKDNQQKQMASEFISQWKNGCEEWRVILELQKLGLDAEVLYRRFDSLSFGEQTKVMLGVLFSGENDFLLIDEPTNHLDQQSREIMKEYLRKKKGFILVSHDRDLLDACIDHVLVLNRSSIEVQSGDFTSWWENKRNKDNFVKMENEKHLKEIGKLKEASERTKRWADKNEGTKIGFDPVKEPERNISTRAYIGAKTKKMQSRVKVMQQHIEREISLREGLLEDIESPVDLKINVLKHYKNRLMLVHDYELRYKEAENPLFQHLDFEINQGERVFLDGANGSGKSSIIKMILHKNEGREAGDNQNVDNSFSDDIVEKGLLELASGVTISYISQDTSFLHGTIREYCKKNNLDESLVCAILRQLDLERVQFEKDMGDYSEGQKKKMLIAASLAKPAHLYIWDEPLNYIDIFSRMQIEKLLLSYRPTMLIVEHDVRFREKIATKIVKIPK